MSARALRSGFAMRLILPAALVAAGMLSGPAHGADTIGSAEAQLALCSDPATRARDALNACRMVAEHGGLDMERLALVWLNAGIAAHSLGRYAEAVESHSIAIASDPLLPAAYQNRALAYAKLNRLNQALADFAAAISLDPAEPGSYLGRGIVMLNNGAPERALADFGKAIELDPASTAARYNRGLAYFELGRNEPAEGDFSAVIGQSPRDAWAYLSRGRARAAADKIGARNDFDRAIALSPELVAAWVSRGRWFDRAGALDQANADFLRAYQLGHSDPWLIERMRQMSGQ